MAGESVCALHFCLMARILLGFDCNRMPCHAHKNTLKTRTNMLLEIEVRIDLGSVIFRKASYIYM
jgi:hypothetical protein